MQNATPIAIDVQKVTKSFGDRNIFQGIDLRVEAGESIVILGFSGSGKSVLLKHIAGYMAPDKGTVRVFGKDWSRLSEIEREALRAKLGIVFQNNALFDALSIKDNLVLPLELRRKKHESRVSGSSSSSLDAWIDARLDEVGLAPSTFDLLPSEISGGMQKRAAIARTLAMQPDLVLYDEPTTGLDPRTAEKISRLIREVHDRRSEATSYTITHDYSCAALVADRILYLDKQIGRLIEVLSASALERLRNEAGKHAPAQIRGYLESYIRSRDEGPAERTSRVARSHIVQVLQEEISDLVTTLGSVLFLFFEMGLPLRLRDFFDRILALGVHSFPLMLGAGFFVGMTGMVQFYAGVSQFKEILPVSLPTTLTSAMLEIIAPLLVGVLLAGRVGSYITTEIGSKTLTGQIDALEALAISPRQLLLAPIVWALVVATPAMVLVASFAGILGGQLMWLSFGETVSEFATEVTTAVNPATVFYAMGKSAVSGALVGLVGYHYGRYRIRTSDDIATAATRTVLISAILIVVADFLFSTIYARF